MKFLAAIFSSVMLMATPFLASAAAPCAQEVKACCAHGNVMPCCAAKDSTPQSAPAVPAQNGSQQNSFQLLAFAVVICALPKNPAHAIFTTTASSPSENAVPLFARNCTLLL